MVVGDTRDRNGSKWVAWRSRSHNHSHGSQAVGSISPEGLPGPTSAHQSWNFKTINSARTCWLVKVLSQLFSSCHCFWRFCPNVHHYFLLLTIFRGCCCYCCWSLSSDIHHFLGSTMINSGQHWPLSNNDSRSLSTIKHCYPLLILNLPPFTIS